MIITITAQGNSTPVTIKTIQTVLTKNKTNISFRLSHNHMSAKSDKKTNNSSDLLSNIIEIKLKIMRHKQNKLQDVSSCIPKKNLASNKL